MIYYLGYYSCEQIREENRKASPPAMNKMGYVISVLSKMPHTDTVVVSPSETRSNAYVKGRLYTLNEHVSLKTFSSLFGKQKIVRALGHFLTSFQVKRYLMKHVKQEDTLIVYHSLSLMRLVEAVKKRKKCKLILEVEEVYADVKANEALRQKELTYFQIADGYIVITEMLNKQVNPQNKPRVISHGTYRANPSYGEKFNDGKIHLVYAGAFDPVKGGAYTAIDAAAFLDEQYVLHILGRGSEANTKAVRKKIEEVARTTPCTVVFDGYKSGREFDSFIQSCHIGLSTQQPDGKYNDSSFPSKILMYMSNGLPVVSIRIPAVESSDVGEFIYYYDSPQASQLAQAIRSVPIDTGSAVRDKLHELDEAFTRELTDLV